MIAREQFLAVFSLGFWGKNFRLLEQLHCNLQSSFYRHIDKSESHKSQFCNFVPNFLISSSVLWHYLSSREMLKFALDIIGICEVWGNKNASLFFEFTYVLGMKTKLYHPGWEWCHTNIAFTFHQVCRSCVSVSLPQRLTSFGDCFTIRD